MAEQLKVLGLLVYIIRPGPWDYCSMPAKNGVKSAQRLNSEKCLHSLFLIGMMLNTVHV